MSSQGRRIFQGRRCPQKTGDPRSSVSGQYTRVSKCRKLLQLDMLTRQPKKTVQDCFPMESTRRDHSSAQREKKCHPPKMKVQSPIHKSPESLDRGGLSHKTNTCGPAAQDGNDTNQDVQIVNWPRDRKQIQEQIEKTTRFILTAFVWGKSLQGGISKCQQIHYMCQGTQ